MKKAEQGRGKEYRKKQYRQEKGLRQMTTGRESPRVSGCRAQGMGRIEWEGAEVRLFWKSLVTEPVIE